MNSNMISRLLPTSHAERSVYEDMRNFEEGSDTSDVEAQGGIRRNTNDMGLRFEDPDYNYEDTPETRPFLSPQSTRQGLSPAALARQGSKGRTKSPLLSRSPRLMEEDADDDVPASLLIEDESEVHVGADSVAGAEERTFRHTAIPGPSTATARARWESVQNQQQLHSDDTPQKRQPPGIPRRTLAAADPREKALWMWANVINLDQFVHEVYEYYMGGGIWCICLGRVLNLLTQAFLAVFITFLTQCIDYSKVPHSKKMDDILIPQCTKKISGISNIILWLFAMYWIYKVFQTFIDSRRLTMMQNFYTHLLRIPESDMQTISWQEIVARLMALRDANVMTMERKPAHKKFFGSQSKERLDAHDIANRLMRRENYLIALFNKDILDLRLPIPLLHDRQLFSRTLEWNLHYCILDFIFTEEGQVRQLVLKESQRKRLSEALRNRFLFAGAMNVICAPVIFTYCLLVYFFKYFNEYQQNPSTIGTRQYTPLAEWKFREFNELPHLFNRRLNMSYPFASRYLEQFPRFKTVQLSKFVSFVAGALLSVLAIATLVDPDLFLGFELTPDRTVLFYVGVLGAIWAGARGSIPDENLVFDPEYALRNVIEYIHYLPNQWKNRLHSDEVKREFAELYKMRILIFLEELLSIIFTPFVLWFTLPKCSDQIIDFFREFTIHVDGLGYVCSFAVFDFKKGATSAPPQGADIRDDYYSTRNGKLAASFYGFMDNYVTNPKTGIPGHVPPGSNKYRFQPPPAYPSMMSPTLAPEMQASRVGRSQRPRSRAPTTAAGVPPLPQSLLLDPHHQPSSSGFGVAGGARSMHGRLSKSRYQAGRGRSDIPEQDEDELDAGGPGVGSSQRDGPIGQSSGEYGYLDGTRWETSPTREPGRGITGIEAEEATDEDKGGVLDLLYQFQRAQTEGRGPGAHL